MSMKKSGICAFFAILLLSFICVSAAVVAPEPAHAQEAAPKNPYAISEGFGAIITYERYQAGIIGFQYSLVLGETYKNPEVTQNAAKILNENYAGSGWTAEAPSDGSALYLSLSFDSVTDYYVAAGITGFDPPEDDSEGISTKTTAFFVYTTNESQTVFAQKAGTPVEFFEAVAANCGVGSNQLEYKYFYATKYKKAFTSTADRVIDYPEFRLHVFNIPGDDPGKKVSVTSRNPNADTWYFIAIGAGVAVAVATAAVIALNYRKKKED